MNKANKAEKRIKIGEHSFTSDEVAKMAFLYIMIVVIAFIL